MMVQTYNKNEKNMTNTLDGMNIVNDSLEQQQKK